MSLNVTPSVSPGVSPYQSDIELIPSSRNGAGASDIEAAVTVVVPEEKPDPEVMQSHEIEIHGQTRLQQLRWRLKHRKEGRGIPRPDLGENIDWHILSVEELSKRLGTSPTGLSQSVAQRKLKEDGPNVITPKGENLVLKFLYFVFLSGFTPILWPCALIAFIAWKPLGNPHPDSSNLALGILFLLVIALSIFFDMLQQWTSSKVMKKVTAMVPRSAIAFRNGAVQQISVSEIVVGDVVKLSAGCRVPADMRLISCDQFMADNSMLTGESEPVPGSVTMTNENFMESHNMAFMGAIVCDGDATGIVVATGDKTVLGKITIMASKKREGTSALNKDVHYFVFFIIGIVIIIDVVIAILWGAWLRRDHKGFLSTASFVALLVATVGSFIPMGMPFCVSLTLTIAAKAMVKQRVLVRELPILHTLSAVTVVASDKTGTLTQNKMSVSHLFFGGSVLAPEDFSKLTTEESPLSRCLMEAFCLCNRAVFAEADKTASPSKEQQQIIGDAADTALLRFVSKYFNAAQIRDKNPKIGEIPFNSKNKWALSIHKTANNDTEKATIIMKGAAEMIIARCSKIMKRDGTILELSEELRAEIIGQQQQFAAQGERVLSVCKQDLDPEKYPPYSDSFNVGERNFPTDNMCFLGMFALLDPPRPEVPEAVKACRDASIRVAMVTGDHPLTAAAIGRQVGIVTGEKTHSVKDFGTAAASDGSQSVVVTGKDVESLTDDMWSWVLSHREMIFSRVQPEQKLQIVKQLQERGEVVAVTGDGVNDSPALKQADVGIAMGSGSDVAKEAGHIILLDSNFSSVCFTLKRGRLLSDNLKKVMLFLLPAGSWAEVLPVLSNIFLGLPLTLSTFLMIYLACLTDVGPSLSLTQEKAESKLMKRPPRKITDRMIDRKLICQGYLFLGNWEALSAYFMFFYYMWKHHGIHPSNLFLAFEKWSDGYLGHTQSELDSILARAQCSFFVGLIIMQLFNLHASRTRVSSFFTHFPYGKRKMRNLYLIVGSLVSLALAAIVIYIPAFHHAFKTGPIPYDCWLIPIGFGCSLLLAEEGRKFIAAKFPHSKYAKLMW